VGVKQSDETVRIARATVEKYARDGSDLRIGTMEGVVAMTSPNAA
jgi:hypothetical protein